MNKEHAYCPICRSQLSVKNDNYAHNCDCYDNKRFKYIRLWCDECDDFSNRRGVRYLNPSRCCRCAVRLQHKFMSENDPDGYSKRQSSASFKANEVMKKEGKGVWGKDFHIQAEKTKLANGTSLSNKEFRKKIGCNGHSADVVKRMRNNKLGIFSDAAVASRPYARKRAHEKTKWLWQNDEEYREKQLRNNLKVPLPNFATLNVACEIHTEEADMYFNKTASYECWSCYKEKFSCDNLTSDSIKLINRIKLIPSFENSIIDIVSTFRDNNSTSWEGARAAFERSLVDKNITWFTYIKFYKANNGDIKPIVVGKSDSLLVNAAGSDVSFSTDISHGPSRRYLNETSQSWHKTEILTIAAGTEEQALINEKIIAKELNLFES